MKTNWIVNPIKLQVIAVLIFYSTAVFLNIMVVTDLFTVSPFNYQYILIYIMMFLATLGVIGLLSNYIKTRNSSKKL